MKQNKAGNTNKKCWGEGGVVGNTQGSERKGGRSRELKMTFKFFCLKNGTAIYKQKKKVRKRFKGKKSVWFGY